MTTETARLVAGVLARRLGIEADSLQATITDNPLGAAVALSMLDPARQAPESDPARVIRFVGSMVGACPVCLGEVGDCGECRGLGKPGTRAANAEALIRWIALPLHQAGLCVGRPRSTAADNNQPGGYIR
jgi:hypothetical protein